MTRRIMIVAGAAALVVAAIVSTQNLVLDGDVARMIPDGDPRISRMMSAMSGVLERITIDVGARDGREVPVEDLVRCADEIVRSLVADGDVEETLTMASYGDALEAVETLRARLPSLVEPRSFPELAAKLEPESIRETLETLARRLQEPDSAWLAERAASDPLGLGDHVLAALRDSAPGPVDARIVGNRVVSRDGRHVLAFLRANFAASDIEQTRRLLGRFDDLRAELASASATADVRLRILGAHRSTLDNADRIRDDVQRSVTVTLLAALGLMVLVYARLRCVVLALVPAAVGAVIAAGVMAIFVDSIAIATLGFGAVLIGLTVDYANHVIISLGSKGRVDERPLLISAATTASAFGALLFSSLPVVREIGIFGAIGVGSAALCAIYVVPALVGGGAQAGRAILDPVRVAERVRGSRVARRARVWSILLLPVVIVGASRLALDGDPRNLSHLTPEAAADEEAILETWKGAFGVTWIAAGGATLEEALDANVGVAEVLADEKARGRLIGYASIAGIMPGARDEARRLAAWRAFWTEERVVDLRRDLGAAVAGTPFRPDGFAPFLESIGATPPQLDPEAAVNGPLARLVPGRVVQTGGRVYVTTAVTLASDAGLQALEDRLAADVPAAVVVSKRSMTSRLAALVVGEVALLAGLALLAVAVLAFGLLGSIELALVVFIPIVVGLGATVGALGWLGIPINLVNSVFGAFLVGGAVDYAILLLHGRLERRRTGADEVAIADAAVGLNAALACLGFGGLAVASHPVLRSIGVTAVLGVMLGWLATTALVPLLAGALIGRGAGGGAPRIRHGLAALRVLVWGMRASFGHRLSRRPARDRRGRRHAAIARIRWAAERVREDLPLGRRDQLGIESEALSVPAIIVANHESHYDSLAIASLPVPVVALVKRYVVELPIVGSLVRDAGYVVIDDGTSEDLLQRCRELIDEGISILVYPEGTRARSGRMGRFRNGAFALARALNVMVVPVALVSTRSVMRPATWWVGDHGARTIVLAPLDPRDFAGDGGDRRMARATRDLVRSVCRRERRVTWCQDHWRDAVANLYALESRRVRWSARRRLERDEFLACLPEVLPEGRRVCVIGRGDGLCAARVALAFPESDIVALETDTRGFAAARAALVCEANVQVVLVTSASERAALEPDVVILDAEHLSAAQETIVRGVIEALAPAGGLVLRSAAVEGDRFRSRSGSYSLTAEFGLTFAMRNAGTDDPPAVVLVRGVS